MGGAYGAPCNGELQFWATMRSQMHEQSKQLARIANALEAGHACKARPTAPAAVDCAGLRKVVERVAHMNDDGYWNSSAQICDLVSLARAALGAPVAFRVGERVDWTDPETGRKTGGWTVLAAPEIPDEGPGGDEVYAISHDSGSEAEVYARELSYPEGGAE